MSVPPVVSLWVERWPLEELVAQIIKPRAEMLATDRDSESGSSMLF